MTRTLLRTAHWPGRVHGATDPHDVDNVYAWSAVAGCAFSGCANGSAFNDFLLRLNECAVNFVPDEIEADGFAGHCDWRLPSLDELRGIVDVGAPGCGTGAPCIDPIFGATMPDAYWTRSGREALVGGTDPTGAWDVYFYNGLFTDNVKTSELYVRAVRTLR